MDSGVGDDKLKGGVVNTGEVASSRGLVFFGAKSERVQVNTSAGVAGVVLEGLDDIKVGAFTFTEAVLAIELKFGGDHRVFTPTVEVKCGLGKDERTSIRDVGTVDITRVPLTFPLITSTSHIIGTSILEKT